MCTLQGSASNPTHFGSGQEVHLEIRRPEFSETPNDDSHKPSTHTKITFHMTPFVDQTTSICFETPHRQLPSSPNTTKQTWKNQYIKLTGTPHSHSLPGEALESKQQAMRRIGRTSKWLHRLECLLWPCFVRLDSQTWNNQKSNHPRSWTRNAHSQFVCEPGGSRTRIFT